MLKYKIKNKWAEAKINVVEVVRETEQSVFLPSIPTRSNPKGENRELKFTDYHEYYDTWESAHTALTNKAKRQVQNAIRQLEIAELFAKNVNEMKKD